MKKNLIPENCNMGAVIIEKLERIEKHLSDLNGKVGTHHDWITRHDHNVDKEIPKNTDMRKRIRTLTTTVSFLGLSNVGTIIGLIISNLT